MRSVPGSIRAALLLYTIGLVAFWPRTLSIADEGAYVSEAVALSRGARTIPGAELISSQPRRFASDYPPGTSLLQALPVAVAGWRGAFAISWLALVALTLLTARWLRDAGLDDRVALLVLLSPPALYFGRTAMSDLPAAAVVAAALVLLTRATRSWRWALAAGVAAGATLLFREPTVLLVAPFALSVFATGRRARWPLVAGAIVGLGVRLALAGALFGDPFYVRDPGVGFSLGAVPANALLYGPILMVLFPLALVWLVLYRGPWRAEVLSAFGAYTLLFLLYDYNPVRDSGLEKGVVLASRYFLPALPLMVLAAADVVPRWLAGRARGGWPSRALLAVALSLAVLVHPLAAHAEARTSALVRAVQERTSAAVPVITNHEATAKYLSPVYAPRRILLRESVAAGALPSLVRLHGSVQLVLLDRSSGRRFADDAARNATFVHDVRTRCRVAQVFSAADATGDSLRIYDVSVCG